MQTASHPGAPSLKFNPTKFVLSPLLGVGICWVTASVAAAQMPKVDFAHQIVPILKQHCAECHGGEEAKGGFSINTRELVLDAGAVTVGKSAESYLVDLITSTDPNAQMPPQENPRVTAEEIALIRNWIDQGLTWEPGFTFAESSYEPPLKPRRPDLPAPVEGRENQIDRIVDGYLADHGIERPRLLSDAAFYRRASLDLIGLLPPQQRLKEFVASDKPNKREQLVDTLLADRTAFAQHWLAMWNDLLRNDYVGTGYVDGGRKDISAWLYRSLLENKPYDQFVRELVSPTAESAGFIQGIKWRGEVNASQQREVQFAQTVPQVFLGINLKCASCHDSFIDRWKLEETYALASVYSTKQLEIHRCDKPTGEVAKAGWLFPELGDVDASAPQPERLEQLARLMTHPENGRLTRTLANRMWHRLMGRGIVHPVDAMHTEPWDEDLLDYLAVYLSDQNYDVNQLLRLIATSRAYQSQAVAMNELPLSGGFQHRGPIAKRMTAEQFMDAVWTITETGPEAMHKKAAEFVAVDEQTPLIRASLVPSDLLMRSLGRPNREQVVSSRPPLLTTLQALDLSNSPTLDATLRGGAGNLLPKFEDRSPLDLVDWLYQAALSRPPSAKEAEIASQLVGEEVTQRGIEDLLWTIVMLPEFQIVR